MSKMQLLKKQVTREAVIVAGAVVAVFVLYMVTGSFADSAMTKKNDAMNQYNQTQSQLGMMRGQITKSDSADKRYAEIKLQRDNEDYLNDTDKLKDLLKQMKDEYRFSDAMRLRISTEKVSEKPEFTPLNYKVVVREDMEMNTAAISDVHVFSFLQELERRMPGFIRVTKLKITRKTGMSIEALAQLSSGNKLEMIDTALKFTWLTLEDKNPAQPEGANAPAQPAQGAVTP